MDTYTARKIVSLSLLAVAAAMGGCKDNGPHDPYPPVGVNSNFDADDAPRAVDNMFAQQAANGSREDGTLYPQHFTDGKLNSLGYQKLSAMTSTPDTGKLAIYLDVPKGDAFFACQDSVMKALARGGVAEGSYTIAVGSNPNQSGPAVAGLAALAHQHAEGATGGASDPSSAPDAATLNPTK